MILKVAVAVMCTLATLLAITVSPSFWQVNGGSIRGELHAVMVLGKNELR
jgi:hypothetical protein